jgi:hypothetical protein
MPKHPTPDREGFWWARWMQQYDRQMMERGEVEYTVSHEWEIVHVVDNNGEGDEKFMVMVPGHSDWQPLADFCWGEHVSDNRPVPISM